MRYIAVLILFLVGCKVVRTAPEQQTMNNSCSQLKDTINKIWKYDLIEQHYIYDKNEFYDMLNVKGNKYRACMESKDTAYIIKLLGKHFRIETLKATDIGPYALVYMLSKYPCLGNEIEYDCKKLLVYFDKTGNVLKVEFDWTSARGIMK
jgi:hypothetical protein